MAVCKTLSLTPSTRATLTRFANCGPLGASATHGVTHPAIMPLPSAIVDALSALGLGPSGFGPDRDAVAFVPCLLDQPAFAAQFVVAYRALANMSPDKTSQDDLRSYGLKHAVEHVWQEAGNLERVYICNGALIAAALAHGYPVRQCPAPEANNAAVSIQRDWRQVMRRNLETVEGFDL